MNRIEWKPFPKGYFKWKEGPMIKSPGHLCHCFKILSRITILTLAFQVISGTAFAQSGKFSSLLAKRVSHLKASFKYSPAFPVSDQDVQFSDASAGSPTSWLWDFGDGMITTAQNPSHAFAKAGFHRVTLTIGNSSESKSVSKTITVALSSTYSLEASFAYSPASPAVGQVVQFTDTSTGSPTSWKWSFGDGMSSSAQNPTHAYATSGSQVVTLTVTNSSGGRSLSRTITVAAATTVPTAAFSFSPSSPAVGQSVQFTDTSLGNPTSWLWNFGDGTTSAAQNPSHTFTTASAYAVSLTAVNASGTGNATRTITVIPALTAAFTYSPAAPAVGQAVQFTDTSIGNPTSWQWDFGDGFSSTAQNPSHAYSSEGNYSVTLSVRAGTNLNNTIRTIVVVPALTASFTYSPAAPVAGEAVQFTDISAGNPTAWQWNFGDGTTSTVQNPSHIFGIAGSYTVSLQVFKMSTSKSSSQTIPIQPALAVSFSFVPDMPFTGQPVQFTDTSTGSPTTWQWSFGDGGNSSIQNPSHAFATASTCTVTLTASNNSGSKSTSRAITVSAAGEGAVFYIDTGNMSASDSNPGTEALPWKTINKANQALAASDTVYIKAGTYTSYIAPSNSGSPSGRITYRAYGSDAVTIQNVSDGIRLEGKSYITVQGINFYNLDRFMYLENNASHNIIAYCNFDHGRNIGWAGSVIRGNSQYNWIHHCRLSNYGYYTDDDIGCVLDIGDAESHTDQTRYNLIEDNIMFHGGHHVFGVFGMYNVIRNNYFHNEPWSMGTAASDRGAIMYGDRNLGLDGYIDNSGRNLFEGNQIAYSSDPPDNVGATGFGMNTSYNIVRLNRFYHNDRAGLSLTLTSSYISDIIYNKVYNNTFFHNGINTQDPDDHMNSGIGFGIYSGSHIIKYNAFKNNLLYKHRVPYGTYYVNLADQIFAGNWDGDTKGNPEFVNASENLGDPMDSSLPDLHLKSISPCKDAGTYLTTITSASGAGTIFSVSDAGYFMDGWGIPGVDGDLIQIVGTSQRARVTKVDYATNTITVDTALTWTQNQGIALAYLGSAPDAGAFEYGTSSPAAPIK